jgi:hypothetical protein
LDYARVAIDFFASVILTTGAAIRAKIPTEKSRRIKRVAVRKRVGLILNHANLEIATTASQGFNRPNGILVGRQAGTRCTKRFSHFGLGLGDQTIIVDNESGTVDVGEDRQANPVLMKKQTRNSGLSFIL